MVELRLPVKSREAVRKSGVMAPDLELVLFRERRFLSGLLGIRGAASSFDS